MVAPVAKRVIQDPVTGALATINPDGRQNVVQHAHPDSGQIHVDVTALTTANNPERYLVIDLSNTTGYPHNSTGHIHVEWVEVQVDSNNIGAYDLTLGFLADVDSTGGDRYAVKKWSGDKTAGNQLADFVNIAPGGWRMRTQNIATSNIVLASTNYQTDVPIPTTLNPSSASVAPGSGDVVLEVDLTAGTIDLSFEIGYHSHEST